jgi:hypothetical protein
MKRPLIDWGYKTETQEREKQQFRAKTTGRGKEEGLSETEQQKKTRTTELLVAVYTY